MTRRAVTLNRSGSPSSGRSSSSATPKKPEQLPLINKAEEPTARPDEWLLDKPREGPGTMPRDAYVVWRYLLQSQWLLSDLERATLRDKDWDIGRTGRAVTKALGCGWVSARSAVRTASDGKQYADQMLTARPEVL
jgi:hypothetical protein